MNVYPYAIFAEIKCNDSRYDAPPHQCFIQCNNNSVQGVSDDVGAISFVRLLNLQPEQNYTCVATVTATNSTDTSSISKEFNFTTTGLYF